MGRRARVLVNICGISLRASYVDILRIGVARQVKSGSADSLGSFARAVTSGSPCHPPVHFTFLCTREYIKYVELRSCM